MLEERERGPICRGLTNGGLLFIGPLKNSCEDPDHDPFNNFEYDITQKGAKIKRPSNRRNKTAEKIKIGIGVMGNKMHELSIAKRRKPTSYDPQ